MIMCAALYKDRLSEIQKDLSPSGALELSVITIYVDGQPVSPALFADGAEYKEIYLQAGKFYIDRL